MPDATADILTDPVGTVVGLLRAANTGLEDVQMAEVVNSVAAGRATQRRLGQALVSRPSLLADGCSPAPRVAGDLLIALAGAGAVNISLPACATCGKKLRTFQRRGENWYCGPCGSPKVKCAGCGNMRGISTRDRTGRPRCVACPPEDGPDPMMLVFEAVARVDPAITEATVVAAVEVVTSRAGQRRQLAWALQDRPELLTGAGAEAPVPSVLRLINTLCEAGAVGLVRPACPRCHRVITLSKVRDGLRICRNCEARARAVPCSRCGAVREPATRDEHGHPLCPNCLSTDPANQETCMGCGRRRPVSVRTGTGPLCPSCRPTKTMICSICQRTGPAEISKATGKPWCRPCQNRWARCTGCGDNAPIRGGTLTEPLCGSCTRPDASFWHTCPGCGQQSQVRSRRCARCSLRRRLHELLSDATGEIHPELRGLHENLVSHERPDTVLHWLNKNQTSIVLAEFAAGQRPLTHAALDELPEAKPIDHLRTVLVATNALAPRDEHLIRLERWITHTITGHGQQQLLHHYAVWHLLRRLRRRNNDQHATHSQRAVIQQHVRAAIILLDWLTAYGLEFATCRQGDLDAWLDSGQATHRGEVGHFVRWANAHKLTSLDFPATRWGGPGVIDTEARWEQARRLLHDDTLKSADRVAGLLVLLYAQKPAVISRLTLDHIESVDGQVRIRLGRDPIVLPEPLATLVLDLVGSRRGHAALGDQGTSRWLFPGGQPGRPISADRLTERLRQLGLHAGKARSTALFQLATELPAALLARMLGIHISVAVAWQRASSGDWMNYAADYSRRPANAVSGRNDPATQRKHSESSNI